ncbi:hypothetical protein [Campylobacter majalis]|uniref:hypothetical protein n=1 Tax=Campylobacter majalis TaxID=2790656 RepID=UPI003D68FB3E
MQYYWEASHFKKEFGNIVLDEIVGVSHHEKMYVKLTSNNIDEHLQNLKKDRAKFIDTKSYRKEVFGIE